MRILLDLGPTAADARRRIASPDRTRSLAGAPPICRATVTSPVTPALSKPSAKPSDPSKPSARSKPSLPVLDRQPSHHNLSTGGNIANWRFTGRRAPRPSRSR